VLADNRFHEPASRYLPRIVIHVSATLKFVNTWGQSAVTKRVTHWAVKGIFGIRKRSQDKLAFWENTFIKVKKAHKTVFSVANLRV
jgi:hypothetical protein